LGGYAKTPIFGDREVRQQHARLRVVPRADSEMPAVEFSGIHDLIAHHQHTFSPHRSLRETKKISVALILAPGDRRGHPWHD
jgi:hypothetical protein